MRDDPLCAPDLPIAARDFLWAVGSLCNMQRRMFDAALVQREFPPPHSAITLVDALRSLELSARIVQRDRRGVVHGKLPCLVFLQRAELSSESVDAPDPVDGSNPAPLQPAAFGLALLVKVEGERLLIFPAGTNEPKIVSATEFDALHAGFALEVANAPEAPTDDEDAVKPPQFGLMYLRKVE